jgi:electron transport complex protein RnfG
MNQWKGFDPSIKKLAVKKDGGDVDAITASTITSRAYTLAVENALKTFASLNDEGGCCNE